MNSTQIRLITILEIKENLIITWTPIFLICRVRHIFLASLKYSPLTPSADVIHKITDSDITSKLADTDSHLIDFLMTQF